MVVNTYDTVNPVRDTARMRRHVTPDHFVDRGRELAQLEAAFQRAAGGHPSAIVVAADAGVGKSRLLHEFASRVGGHVLWGACLPISERGLPFAPFVEVLRSLLSDPELCDAVPASLRGLVSDTNGSPVVPAPQIVSRSQLFQAVLGLLEDLADGAPVVLVLEDLHWADPSTRDLLTFLVSNLRWQRLLLVVSCRSDDLRREHPLRPVLAELSRQPLVERLDVAPFTARQVAEQLEHLTGESPAPDALQRVLARTQGNAFFVEELVAAGLDDRALPRSLRELLLVRVDIVSKAARRLVRIVALAERDVDDALLADVSATPLGDVRALLHEAVDAHLAVIAPRGVQLRHTLLREALRQDLLPGERAEYHAAYATALTARIARTGRRDAATLAELAFHLQQSGNLLRAIGAWVDAAAAAESVLAFAEAHQHLARALAAWDAVDDPERHAGGTRVDLLARAAEDAFNGGDAVAACALVGDAIDGIDEAHEARAKGILYERLSRYLRDTPDRDQVQQAIERAVALVPTSPPSVERARVLAGLAGRLSTAGHLHEARRRAEEAIAMAREVGSILVECDAMNTLGAVNCYLDDDAVGLAQIEEAMTLATSIGDAHQQMRAYWNLGVLRAESGRIEEAIEQYRTAIEELPRLGLAHLLPELYAYTAEDLTRIGRWDAAQAAVDEAAHRFPSRRDEAAPIELVVARGDFDEARRLIAAATARNVFTDDEGYALVLVNLAETEIWESDIPAARSAIDEALRVVADSDRPIAAAHVMRAGMRCEAEAAEEARARRQPADLAHARHRATQLHSHMQDLLARPGPTRGWKREVGVLAAICDGERSRVEGHSDESAWAEAGKRASALTFAYLLAYCRFRLGEALIVADGDRDDATEHLRCAHQCADTMGARPLRQLIERFARRARIDVGSAGGVEDAFGITPREREVLRLLVQGATNRHIAEQLFIAEKTASVHVSNIIRKLGVANRGQAAALAHRHGLVDR